MQVKSKPNVTALFDRLTANELSGRRGLEAWCSLLRAHATLMRQLETDLEKKTGMALADFDVLAQLALAGGELRMTDLFFFSSRRRHTRLQGDWSSDVCSSD